MRELSTIYKALSDETRLRIMGMLLLRGELCVCDVEGALGITQSKSSRHLRSLLHAGLVVNRREGQWMHYRIPKELDESRRTVVKSLARAIGDGGMADLEDRLAAWFERKESGGVTCKAS